MQPSLSPVARALMLLRPGADWCIAGEQTYANLIWNDPVQTKPSEADVTAAITGLPDPNVPQSISDVQFFQQLVIDGIITEDQALAANAAVIPAPLLTLISALPPAQQFDAKMKVSGVTTFSRNHPLTIEIGTAYGWSSAQLDAFFTAAALL